MDVTLGWWVVGFCWLVCGYGGWRLWQKKLAGQFHQEHIFYSIALGLLASAAGLSVLQVQLSVVGHWWGGLGPATGAAVVVVVARRFRADRLAEHTDEGSAISFREKSARLMLAALLISALVVSAVIGVFGWEVLIPAAVAAVLFQIVIAIVGHTLIAIMHRPLDDVEVPRDERDREVSLLSSRNAYYTLGVGVWSVPVLAFLGMPVFVLGAMACTAILVAELVYYGSLVRYYKVGIV